MSKLVAGGVYDYPEILSTLSDATRFLAEYIHADSMDSFLITFRSVKNESRFSIVYKELERNEAARQEAERVVLGLWGHWRGCEAAAQLYNPHRKTREYIATILDDIDKFFKLCFDKYWSTLGSANSNHKIGVSYMYDTETIDRLLEENDIWIEQYNCDIEQYDKESLSESYQLKKISKAKHQMVMNLSQ